ncbi:hypothetical protein NQ317_011837 [Molorchus minor]|uniref:Integrase p58-like C-terminal domain-containing protein n=1 Tax=Molorchus minor TaxID=1323400 RepID=A0ABQ9J7E2_9CUCU|nr:hypothetical protein NQ317_011837 [Molorchus minor]
MKQFDAAANVNNWSESEKATALIVSLRGDALEILQTLDEDQHKNYEELVLQLEMRNQRINENLQQYEADIARLVYLAYPTAPRDFIEQLAVQVFIDGIRDCETQQALRLARCKKLNEVLAYALEFEAAKQASRGHTRIRQIRTRTPERESNNSGYQAGDEVWLYNPARKKGRSPKLQKTWEGPYTVIKRINDLVYRIQRGPRAKMKVVHLDRLAPYRRPHEELVDRDDHP